MGAGIAFVLSKLHDDAVLAYERFDFDFFIVWLLPPIIFEAGYTLKRRLFLANLAPILTFAVVGTLASTAIVVGVLQGAAGLGAFGPDVFGGITTAAGRMPCSPLVTSW